MAGIDLSFDRAVVLLHYIIEIANGSTATTLAEFPTPLELLDGLRVRGILIYINDSWTRMV